MLKNISDGVAVWEQDIVIPTYPAGKPDKNPMFLEKRVYQGSSGRVYPHTVIDKIHDEKVDKTYRAVCLENKYLFIMVLPELGGRIQRALDKTNHYDFVYYNHVIKPALVGLCGPWISGGIEFNWPQHHRPSTFDPVSFQTLHNDDGSKSIVVGEIENMFRTKGMATFTLYPDRAYLEISARLYNRTEQNQTFLWWANPAVPVNDDAQSIFPPDVHAVMDHGKRAVSDFPIATGTYYKQDYSAGVDISRYKNIPVPTSYMAYHSDYDFVGGYDWGKEAGILHVADHHISPGKKQWTWGCGDFGKAWDRNLTDEDGPYVELMTGCFTDNQPDFTWLSPYEEKTFTQYFMPYKKVGAVKNACKEAAVGLKLQNSALACCVYAACELKNARVRVTAKDKTLDDCVLSLSPVALYEKSFEDVGAPEEECRIEVFDNAGRLLIAYQPQKKELKKLPEPAKEIPAPKDAASLEDLYLYGLHLEQYRHATFEPMEYYLEGLRRDPTDIRLNNACGALWMRRGRYESALPYLQAAAKKLCRQNPNPYDGEPFYHLGLCLLGLSREEEAYDAFYKATWNAAWQSQGFYQLSLIDARRRDYPLALDHVSKSLVYNAHHMQARGLKARLLLYLGREKEALDYAAKSLTIDPLDLPSQLVLGNFDAVWRILSGNHNTAIELALELKSGGFYKEARAFLEEFLTRLDDPGRAYPLVYYHLGSLCLKLQDKKAALRYFEAGETAPSFGCFPHRCEDIEVLLQAQAQNPGGAMAHYYLGCLWYDKKQSELAVTCWERARALRPSFPTVHRNLSLAYYNKRGEKEKALLELETAFSLDPGDARVLLELDQLYKKLGRAPKERLSVLRRQLDTVMRRDDLTLEYISLLNLTGEYENAMALLSSRQFHPWEGGEGKAPAEYRFCRMMLALKAIEAGDCDAAMRLLWETTVYPHNLGEGKLANAQENDVYFMLGLAYRKKGEEEKADECFQKASSGLCEPAGMLYYNDQPPETIYYQGLALLALSREDEARGRFHKLLSFGEQHIFDEVKPDYFAVSLPDLLTFDEDLNQRNRVHCLFMMGLGHLGLGNAEKADACFDEALALSPARCGAVALAGVARRHAPTAIL